MQQGARGRVWLLPTVRHGKERPLQRQRKGNVGLSFASSCCSLVLPFAGWMNYASASGTCSMLLSGDFSAASTLRAYARGFLIALPLVLTS